MSRDLLIRLIGMAFDNKYRDAWGVVPYGLTTYGWNGKLVYDMDEVELKSLFVKLYA